MLCGAELEASLSISIFIAAVAVWTTTTLGALLIAADPIFSASSLLRTLAIAGMLLVIAPFVSITLALVLAMVLGLAAIYTAIMRLPDLLKAA